MSKDVQTTTDSEVAVDRFTEIETVKQAGTDAHPDVVNEEVVKDLVDQVIKGPEHKLVEGMFVILTNNLANSVAKLKLAKTTEERVTHLNDVNIVKNKLELLIENFQ